MGCKEATQPDVVAESRKAGFPYRAASRGRLINVKSLERMSQDMVTHSWRTGSERVSLARGN